MSRARHHLEITIEQLIELLDEVDGDADFEIDEPEEQHDREADPAENGLVNRASLAVVAAAMSMRKISRRG